MNKRGRSLNLIASRDSQVAETRQMVALGLPNFETRAQCNSRNERMLRRFQKHGVPPHLKDQLQLHTYSSGAEIGCDTAVDGDWRASRRYRLMLLPQAFHLLKKHQGPTFFVTIAHPKWELPIGQLQHTNIPAVKQWLGRRLKILSIPVMVIGGFEASIRVERNGDTFWAGHLHLTIAGADQESLKTVLKIENHYVRQMHSKPVTVVSIGNLAKRLGYSTKRIAKRSLAYVGDNGRQQRRQLPLTLSQQIEFDSWLLGMPAGTRTILFGCRLHREKLCRT
jgi:hypothetical protein